MDKGKISFIVTIAIIMLALVLGFSGGDKLGSAGEPLASFYVTAQTSVGPSNSTTIFTANTVCASRLITTKAQPIMISFDSATTPTGIVGHLQSASTTVSYDAGIYGCDTVKVYGYGASTTLTTSEFR